MAATLCNYAFANIACCIIIEMGDIANKHIAPIASAHSHFAAWSKLKVAMCSKVYKCIGLETFLNIQGRCNITMRRCNINTMYQFEIIIAQCWSWLRKQEYVSISDTGNGNAVAARKKVAWSFSVSFYYFCIFISRQHFFCPLLVLLGS